MELNEAKHLAKEIKKNCKKLTIMRNTLLTCDSVRLSNQEFVDVIKEYDVQQILCWPAHAGEAPISIYHVGFYDGTDKIKWYSTLVSTEEYIPSSRKEVKTIVRNESLADSIALCQKRKYTNPLMDAARNNRRDN